MISLSWYRCANVDRETILSPDNINRELILALISALISAFPIRARANVTFWQDTVTERCRVKNLFFSKWAFVPRPCLKAEPTLFFSEHWLYYSNILFQVYVLLLFFSIVYRYINSEIVEFSFWQWSLQVLLMNHLLLVFLILLFFCFLSDRFFQKSLL